MDLTEDLDARGISAAMRAMIDSQLRTSGVNEPWVLAAMARVPREDYVPETMRSAAYIDRAIPLGEGRWLAPPLVQGRMLAEAVPLPEDKVLLVGDGEGYLAALLRPMVGSLDTIAPARARETAGAGAGGDYSLLVIDGAIEEFPDALADRLADDARVVCGIVTRGVTRLARGRKAAGGVSIVPLAEMGIPVLPEFAAARRWSF